MALTVRSSRRFRSSGRSEQHDDDDPTLAAARAEVERIDPISSATWDGL